MPTPQARAERRALQKQEILRRVAAGEGLCAVCAEPRMPNVRTVYKWFPADRAFEASLKSAQARADWRRRYASDEPRQRAFLARLAAGEALRDLVRDPAMPGPATLRYWRATDGWFGPEVLRIIQTHRIERGGGLRRRPPRPYDPALTDRILFLVGQGHSCKRLARLDPRLPSYRTLREWRRADPQFDADLKVNIRFGRTARARARRMAVLEPLVDGIVQGGSFRSLERTEGIPGRRSLGRWVACDAEFRREVLRACEQREHWYADQLMEIAEAVTPATVADARRAMAPLNRQLARLRNRPGRRRPSS